MSVNDSNLRALIRLIPMARAMKDEVDKIANLELYEGGGDLIAASFQRLLAGVTRLTDDPYVASLGEGLSGDLSDKQKVLAVTLAVSQLTAYIESETGLANLGGGGGHNYNTGPNINIGQAYGLSPKQIAKAAGIEGEDAEDDEETERG